MNGGFDLLSMMTGMMMKLHPWTMTCSRQFVRFCLSFSGGSCSPLMRKMRATAPYKTLYSDRMTPPCSATSVSTSQLCPIPLNSYNNFSTPRPVQTLQPHTTPESRNERHRSRREERNLRGKKHPNTQATPKPMSSHCAATNSTPVQIQTKALFSRQLCFSVVTVVVVVVVVAMALVHLAADVQYNSPMMRIPTTIKLIDYKNSTSSRKTKIVSIHQNMLDLKQRIKKQQKDVCVADQQGGIPPV